MDALRPFPRLLLALTICAAFAVALIGCSASQNTNTANSNATPAAGNTNKTTANTAASPATPSGEKIGVAECDDYLAKLEACVGKMPAAAKEQYDKTMETTRKSWRDAAATPQGKAGLAAACKQATDMAKTSMKSFNCEF